MYGIIEMVKLLMWHANTYHFCYLAIKYSLQSILIDSNLVN
jgi:hypothetical protein